MHVGGNHSVCVCILQPHEWGSGTSMQTGMLCCILNRNIPWPDGVPKYNKGYIGASGYSTTPHQLQMCTNV